MRQTAIIRARETWNHTGIELAAGHSYQMLALGKWTDFFIKRDANGFTSDEAILAKVLRKHERRRRMPRENWFALIGAIDRDETTAFKIGTALTFDATATGELTCFANDEPGFYFNNWGSIELTVTLVK